MANPSIITKLKADTSEHDKAFNQASRTVKSYSKQMTDMGGAMKSVLGMMPQWTTAAGAVAVFGQALASNVETAKNFEKSMSSLSSLTGLTGEKLGVLKDAAIELGSKTTQSASQVADAFKLIGSQMPQLLDSPEALKNVTKEVITLSEAAGIELTDAAKTMAVSINQMGASSDDATRYVNVLAAASQKGAGDITWLGEAITKSGTAAKAVGTGYEELVATLEQLAQAGYDSSTAGTALRSIIMSLEKQSNSQFKPSIVGLTQAFANLSKESLTLSQYQEIVGKEMAAQAMVLANNADKCRDFTSAITGTNTAEEQAKINTDNLEGALKSLESAWEGLNLTLNDSNSALKPFVEDLTELVGLATDLVSIFKNLDINLGDVTKRFLEQTPVIKDVILAYRIAKGEIKLLKDYLEGGGDAVLDGATGAAGKTTTTTTTTSGGSGASVAKVWDDSTRNGIKEHLKYLDEERDKVKLNSKEYAEYTQQIENLNNKLNPKANKTKTIKLSKEQIKSFQIDPSAFAESLNEQLDGKIPPIEIPVKLEDNQVNWAKTLESRAEMVKEQWATAADAIGQVGNALQQIDDPSAKVAGIMMEAVANIISSYTVALTQAASAGPWAWIAFAASGLATMMATISSVKSAGNFADGGVVGGNSYSGDRLIAHVNSGETILSRKGVINAIAAIDNASATTGGGGGQPYVTGDKIYLAVNNYLRAQGKGQLVTTRG